MSRKLALEKLETLYQELDPKTILEHILENYLSGSEALEALNDVENEFCGSCDTCEEDDCEI